MSSIIYFAYGSNMKTERLRARVSSAKSIGIAKLPDMRLVFNKQSKDGSGKANLIASPVDMVWGVLFEIEVRELGSLDKAEGGYARTTVEVISESGESMTAHTYISSSTTASAIPYEWYKNLVVAGAREHRLPESYIAAIESIPTKPSDD